MKGPFSLLNDVCNKAVSNIAIFWPSFSSVVPRLTHVYLELTNFCNLKCEMCYGHGRKQGFMSLDLFERVVDDLASLHVNWLALHYGGESLLHPKFKEMLKYVMERRNCFGAVGLQSNGMLFDDSYAQLAVDLSLDFVGFSLEGLGMLNDNIRRGSSYWLIENNIMKLLEIRGERQKPTVTLNLTHFSQSQKDIDAFVKHWVGKVDFITENPCTNEQIQIEHPELFFAGKPVRKAKFCSSPFDTMGIFWNGDVVPCCRDNFGMTTMGNVTKTGVEHIWNGDKYRSLRKACVANSFLASSACYLCDAWKTDFFSFKTRRDGVLVETRGQTIKYGRM